MSDVKPSIIVYSCDKATITDTDGEVTEDNCPFYDNKYCCVVGFVVNEWRASTRPESCPLDTGVFEIKLAEDAPKAKTIIFS